MTPPTTPAREKLEAIRQACIEVNPNIRTLVEGRKVKTDIEVAYRPIRLADVVALIAVRGWNSTEEWFEALGALVDKWALFRDDLTQQSPETIDFLYGLLSPNQ